MGTPGSGRESVGTYIDLCVWTGRMDESTVNVPERSPTPAAAHTGAGWARLQPTPRPTHARVRGRRTVLLQRVCPTLSKNRCRGLTRRRGQRESPIVRKKAGNSGARSRRVELGRVRRRDIRGALQSPAVQDAPRRRLQREAGGLPAELNEIGSSVIAQSAHSSKSPSELIYLVRILWVYN